jgi:hypothetical protein
MWVWAENVALRLENHIKPREIIRNPHKSHIGVQAWGWANRQKKGGCLFLSSLKGKLRRPVPTKHT